MPIPSLHFPVRCMGGVSISLQMAAKRKKLTRKTEAETTASTKEKGSCLEFKLARLLCF